MSASAAAVAAVGLGQAVVLRRLLTPRDFGLMGMMWVAVGFVQAFSDMGMSNAIVQRQDATADQLSSVYWLNVLAGLLVAVVIISAVPMLVSFYHEPALRPLGPWVAVSVVFVSVGQPFQSVAQRDLHFSRLASADTLGTCSGAIVSIVTAYLRFGVLSLIFGTLAGALVRTFILIGWETWRPSLHFKRTDLHGFIRFGLYQMGERMANYVWSNVDYLMVGRFLGAVPLGIYSLAYETVIRPLSSINPILNIVAYPLFTKKQKDDSALRRGFVEVIGLVSTLVFPIMAGLGVTAPLVVRVVFGEKWLAAVPIIQILCILGALRALSNPVGSLLLAKGKVEVSFRWNVLLAVANTTIFWFVARKGIRPLAWAEVATMLAIVVFSWKSYYYDSIRLPVRNYIGAIARSSAFSLVMAAFVYWLFIWLKGTSVPKPLFLAILVSTGAATYILLYLFFDRTYVHHLWSLVVSRAEPERRVKISV
jgi:lipopolysaccharide exporter